MNSYCNAIFLASLCLAAPAAAELPQVLARMDASATGFRGAAANVKRTSFTALIRETEEETGTIKFTKSKNDVRLLLELTKPDPRSVAFAGRKAQLFYPKINTVREIDLGKQKSFIDQFLLLGFGTAGKDLGKSYQVKYRGEETISGQKASRIELVPNAAEVKQQFNRIELWIADPGGYPVQQKLYAPSGNHLTVTYTEVQVNPALTPESVSLKLPKDVKREYPQK